MAIDLANVRSRLNAALDIVDDLRIADQIIDTDTGNPTGSRRNTSERERAASLSRELLHLADHLDHTAALVREQYWSMKGLTP
jgi:hypothetical protein